MNNNNKHSKLTIAILAAKDLAPKDRNSLSDPFCEIRLLIDDEKEEPKYKTRVVENNLNPTWNEIFVFINSKFSNPTTELRIKCFDQNRYRYADFEGIVKINVHEALGSNDINNDKIYEKWLPFEPYEADIDVSGDLHVMMSWGDLPPSILRRPSVLSPEQQKRLEYQKKLELQQLRKLEGGHRKKKPILNTIALVGDMVEENIVDPVKERLGTAAEPELVRDVVSDYEMSESDDDNDENRLAPTSGLERQTLYFYVQQLLTRPIAALPSDVDADQLKQWIIEALEIDTLQRMNTKMRQPRLKYVLENLLFRYYTLEEHPAYRKKNWLTKTDYYSYVQRERDVLAALVRGLLLPEKGVNARIHIHVMEAKDVAPLDSNGLSDCYCVIQIGSETRKTKTIMRTLNPVWDEKHVLRVRNLADTLEISVWDYDTTSEDDWAGSVSLPIADLVMDGEVNKWYRLGQQGDLHLDIKLDFKYCDYLRALENESLLSTIGLRGLEDGSQKGLPEKIDKNLDHIDYIVELLESVLIRGDGIDSSRLSAARWLLNEYGARFGVPFARRRLEFLRLLVRVANNNKLPESDKDVYAWDVLSLVVQNDEDISDVKAKARRATLLQADVLQPSAELVNGNTTVDPELVTMAYNALADVRRLVPRHLAAAIGEDGAELPSTTLAGSVKLLQTKPNSHKKHQKKNDENDDNSDDNEKQERPCHLSRMELVEFRRLSAALWRLRIGVLSRFKELYTTKAARGTLAQLCETVEELAPTEQSGLAALQAAVKRATAKYFGALAPVGSRSSLEGVMALHTALEEQLDDDDIYSLSFPRNSAYIDITTNIYLKEHAAAIDEFCNHCAYTGDVFTVFAKARELRATMLERLSEDLRADVAPFNLVDAFTPYVFDWLKATSARLLDWVGNAISIDERQPVTEQVLYSAAVVDVFSSIDSAYQYLEKLNLNTMFFSCQYAEVTCEVMQRYVEIEAHHFAELIEAQDSTSSDDEEQALSRQEKLRSSMKRATSKAQLMRDSSDRLTSLLHNLTSSDAPLRPSSSFGSKLKNSFNSSSKRNDYSDDADDSDDNMKWMKLPAFEVDDDLCICIANVEEARFKLDELLDRFNDPARLAADDGQIGGNGADSDATRVDEEKVHDEARKRIRTRLLAEKKGGNAIFEPRPQSPSLKADIVQSLDEDDDNDADDKSGGGDDDGDDDDEDAVTDAEKEERERLRIEKEQKLAAEAAKAELEAEFVIVRSEFEKKVAQARKDAEAKKAILAESFESLSSVTFRNLSARRKLMIQLLADRVHRQPAKLLAALEHEKQATSEEICAYYDSQWMVLSQKMRTESFCLYLEEAWLLLMRDLKRKLLHENPHITETFVNDLINYFHGDGHGCDVEWLRSQTDGVMCLIKYNMLSTYQLVKFYWSQKRSLIADDQSSKQQQIAPVKLEQSQIKLLNDNMRYVVAIIEARVNFGDDSDEDATSFLKELRGGSAVTVGDKTNPSSKAGGSSSSSSATANQGAHNDLTPGVMTKEDKLRKLFMLPHTELIIEDFACRCTTLPGVLGKMYITTSHVCYTVNWGDDDLDHTPETLVFEIEAIYSIRPRPGWVSGSLFITAFNSQGVANELEFDHFLSVKKCVALLHERAKLLNYRIEQES